MILGNGLKVRDGYIIVPEVYNYPPAHTGTYVKATSTNNTEYPYQATDPSKSLTGSYSGKGWRAAAVTTNQRFHIDVGSALIVNKIYYENYHDSGTATDRGVKNFSIWGSNSATAFAELTYATDTNWTQIATGLQFEQHTSADAADPKYITFTNTTAYRYYALKIADHWGSASSMGIRRIVLQTAEIRVRK